MNGINIAQTLAGTDSPVNPKSSEGGEEYMKELGNSLAQLAAIIMILITIAISTAAFSQWTSAPATPDRHTSESSLVAGG